jgi:peptidase E
MKTEEMYSDSDIVKYGIYTFQHLIQNNEEITIAELVERIVRTYSNDKAEVVIKALSSVEGTLKRDYTGLAAKWGKKP